MTGEENEVRKNVRGNVVLVHVKSLKNSNVDIIQMAHICECDIQICCPEVEMST